MQLIKELNSLNIKVKIQDNDIILEGPEDTLKDLELISRIKDNKSKIINWFSQTDRSTRLIPSYKPQEYYPLSTEQYKLWVLNQIPEVNKVYNIFFSLKLSGDLDFEKFQWAIDKVIQRHESLRTTFELNFLGEPQQKINHINKYVLKNKRITASELGNEIREFENKYITISDKQLFEIVLFRLNDKEHFFLFKAHHILLDGWSIEVLLKEVSNFYNEPKESNFNEKKLRIQYKDFSLWQNSNEFKNDIISNKKYWIKKFQDGISPPVVLPSFKKRPKVRTFSGKTLKYKLNSELLKNVNSFAGKNNTSVFSILCSAINGLIYRYTNLTDITLGVPNAGRFNKEMEAQIGLYINVLPIRTIFNKNDTFQELISSQKTSLTEAFEHQNYPFENLLDELSIRTDKTRSPFFDIMVVMQNQRKSLISDRFSLNDIDVETNEFEDITTSKFDLTFFFLQHKDNFELRLEYNTEIFDKIVIDNLADNFKLFLSKGVNSPNTKICDINFIGESQRKNILKSAKGPSKASLELVGFLDLIKKQSLINKEDIAVEFKDNKLSYYELNSKSNKLVRYILNNKSLKKRGLVAVCLSRSEYIVIILLALIKAGLRYTIIDESLPENRKKTIFKDSDCKLIIDNEFIENFNKVENSISLDEVNLPEKNNDEIMYLMYTSGSTGKPKGALNTYRGFLNTLSWYIEDIGIHKNDNVGVVTNLSFDLTHKNLLAPLLVGAKICLNDDIVNLSQFIKEKKISILNCAPSTFYIIKNVDGNISNSLKKIILGGESVNPSLIKDFLNNKRVKFFNSYGPSEASDVTTFCEIKENLLEKNISIGKPIRNVQNYVLDENLKLMSLGSIGEIYIGGVGVGLGYYQTGKEKNETHFIQHSELGFIYKTGDLGKLLEDGTIEFCGRIDSQVKISGIRVEIEEIENTIAKLYKKEILNLAVVYIKKANNNRLICFAQMNKGFKNIDFKEKLKQVLPDYMIPSAFVEIDKMPVLPNGKIDRNYFHKIDLKDKNKKLLQPNNIYEVKVLQIWNEFLHIDEISIDDDFYSLGGDSLRLIKILQKVNFIFNIEIKFSDLIKDITIQNIAILIKSLINKNIDDSHIDTKKPSVGSLAKTQNLLSYQQKSLLIKSLNKKVSAGLNIPMLIEFKSLQTLNQILNKLLNIIKNDFNFNSCFVYLENEKSYLRKKVSSKIEIEKKEFLTLNDLEDFIRLQVKIPFNLFSDRLIKVFVFEENEKNYLFFIVNHLIFDLESMFKLLQLGTNSFESEIDIYSYENYILDQKKLLSTNLSAKCLEYLISKDLTGYNSFIYDKKLNSASENIVLSFEPVLSEEILKFCTDNNITVNHFFVLLFVISNYQNYSTENSVFKIVESGRFNYEHNNILGLCRNYLPMSISIDGKYNLIELIETIKKEFVKVLSFQGIPFYDVIEDSKSIEIGKKSIYFNNLYNAQSNIKASSHDWLKVHNSTVYNSALIMEKFGIILAKNIDEISFDIIYINPEFQGENFIKEYHQNILEIAKIIVKK